MSGFLEQARLTDEEIRIAEGILTRPGDGFDADGGRPIADAATAKALWAVVDLLMDRSPLAPPDDCGHCLQRILEQGGVCRMARNTIKEEHPVQGGVDTY